MLSGARQDAGNIGDGEADAFQILFRRNVRDRPRIARRAVCRLARFQAARLERVAIDREIKQDRNDTG